MHMNATGPSTTTKGTRQTTKRVIGTGIGGTRQTNEAAVSRDPGLKTEGPDVAKGKPLQILFPYLFCLGILTYACVEHFWVGLY